MLSSFHQIKKYIDRLGDLENALVRSCTLGEVLAKTAKIGSATSVAYLKEACETARSQLQHVRDAKDRLLGLEGFLQAQKPSLRGALENPAVVSYIHQVGARVSKILETHAEAVTKGALEALRRVAHAIKDVQEAKAREEELEAAKAAIKALVKSCSAAEAALRKGLETVQVKEGSDCPCGCGGTCGCGPQGDEPEDHHGYDLAMGEAAVAETPEQKVASHGYRLTA